MASSSNPTTIFVGSSVDLEGLAAPPIAATLLAEEDVGLYGHEEGIVNAYNNGTEAKVLSEWAGTGAGLIETTQGDQSPMAVQQLTVANTGNIPLVIPVGQIVSSNTGVQFQVVEHQRQDPDWSPGGAGDGSLGIYTVPPGQSATLTAQALNDGPSGNLLPNQLTTINIPNASITGSTLTLAAPQWSAGTVTLHNNSTATQTIWERTALTGTNGSYQVGVDPAVSGFAATDADGSSGYYVLKADASITLPIGSVGASGSTASAIVAAEQATNAPANSITGGVLPAGVTVTGSSVLNTKGAPTPASQTQATSLGANTGFFTDAQIQLWNNNQGYNPTEADVNTTNNYIWTAQDLQNWEAYVDAARSSGVLSLAPMLSEFETVDFATSAATASVRAGALYSGGIAFDMPPWFFLAREPAYQQSTYDEIRWANQNGLRSSITISPEGPGDETFLADTQKMVAMLQANGALPTQIVVKDEGVLGSSGLYSATDPNSLNNVAAWLGANIHLTPSTSESGLELTGTTSRPDDVMTGIQSGVTVLGAAATAPFVVSQLFGEDTSTVATLKVTLSAASIGHLSAGAAGGTVSADGSTFTTTGTMAQLSQALQAVSFTAASGAQGSATLVTTVTDAAGTITGSTLLSVNNGLSLSGVPASASISGGTASDADFTLSAANPTAPLTATITLSNPAVAGFQNTATGTSSSDGSTLTINGTASFLQNTVRQLTLVMAPGAPGSETATISVTNGTQTVSGSTAITMASSTDPATSHAPASAAMTTGTLAPSSDVLLSHSGNPSAAAGSQAGEPSVSAGTPVAFTDASLGQDRSASGSGNVINLGAGRYTVHPGSGNIITAGSSSFSFLNGSTAADTGGLSLLVSGSGSTVLHAADGNDTLGGGGHAVFYGAPNMNTQIRPMAGDTALGAPDFLIVGPISGTATLQLGASNETVPGSTEAVVVSAANRMAATDGLGHEISSLLKDMSTDAAMVFDGLDPTKDRIVTSSYSTVAGSQAVGTTLTLSDGASIMLHGLSHLEAPDFVSA